MDKPEVSSFISCSTKFMYTYVFFFFFFFFCNVLNIFLGCEKKKDKKRKCMYLFTSYIYSCFMYYIIICFLFMEWTMLWQYCASHANKAHLNLNLRERDNPETERETLRETETEAILCLTVEIKRVNI